MVTSKIILLLRNMNKNELAKFRDFLASPYFNHKSKLLTFYEKLFKFAPEFKAGDINKEKIYRSVYPESKFNEQVYKNLSSELYLLAKKFFSIHGDDGGIEQDISYLRNLERIGADELFKIELKQVRSRLNDDNYYETLFYNRFRAAVIERTFNINRSNFAKAVERPDESDELMKFYFIHLFRQKFDQVALSLNFKLNHEENPAMFHMRRLMETGVLDETMQRITLSNTKNHEVVAMYYNILMALLHGENDTYLAKAKELVFKNIGKFELSERFNLTGALYGLSSFKLRLRGTVSDYRDTFDIINFRLNRKLYKEEKTGYISALAFRAMFMTGAFLREISWLKKFLKKYIPDVTPEHRENLNNLLSAHLKFYEKKFDDSLNLLSIVKYDISLYKLDVRKLQLFNYYELGHTESALSLISSFREFLNSNKEVTEDERSKHLTVLNYCSKLMKLKEESDGGKIDTAELETLRQNIANEKVVLYRWWFEEKIAELKK